MFLKKAYHAGFMKAAFDLQGAWDLLEGVGTFAALGAGTAAGIGALNKDKIDRDLVIGGAGGGLGGLASIHALSKFHRWNYSDLNNKIRDIKENLVKSHTPESMREFLGDRKLGQYARDEATKNYPYRHKLNNMMEHIPLKRFTYMIPGAVAGYYGTRALLDKK